MKKKVISFTLVILMLITSVLAGLSFSGKEVRADIVYENSDFFDGTSGEDLSRIDNTLEIRSKSLNWDDDVSDATDDVKIPLVVFLGPVEYGVGNRQW